MATYNSNGDLIEVPLIFNDQEVTKEIAVLRDKVEELLGPSDMGPLKGLREDPNGQWIGVYEQASE